VTGEHIVTGSHNISSNEFLFVERKYSFDGTFPTGVYKINWYTGEVEVFEISK
jgi:hypothetical protein